MEDGKIDESELDEQEQRLVGLMQEIEPQLDDALHERVTELLCELTAYDLMQTLHSISSGPSRCSRADGGLKFAPGLSWPWLASGVVMSRNRSASRSTDPAQGISTFTHDRQRKHRP